MGLQGCIPDIGCAGAEAVLSRALALWRPGEFPNGLVIFSSKKFVEAMHQLQPLHSQTYTYDNHFDTSEVMEALKMCRATYGVIVIDGDEATIGTGQASASGSLKDVTVSKVGHFSAHIGSRIRRGGQSALRYGRLRDGAELAFLKKIV